MAVAGNTIGPITVVPSRIRMPSVASRTGASQDLALIVRGNPGDAFRGGLEIREAPGGHPSGGEAGGPRGRYRLTVTVPPGTPPGLVDEPIVLKTDHPKVKELRIPVSIYVSTRSEAG